MESKMSRSDKKMGSQVGCAAPEIGAMVHDYYNGALDAPQVREFERHMIACRHCESMVIQLDEVMMVLDDDQDIEGHPLDKLQTAIGQSLHHKAFV
jgi:anti-sigma factor RsiW